MKIDIKPGSDTNPINLAERGDLPVAILTTSTFNASTVDPSTVRFGKAGTEALPIRYSLSDVNGDGLLDLMLHFNVQDAGFQPGDNQGILTGSKFGGTAIYGTDSILTITASIGSGPSMVPV